MHFYMYGCSDEMYMPLDVMHVKCMEKLMECNEQQHLRNTRCNLKWTNECNLKNEYLSQLSLIENQHRSIGGGNK